MADTNMQKELSNLLGKKTLDPLEQTIFETGPKGGFTPPESINLYKETPTQFAQQPIGIEGSDIDWYALGESGFKIANETFGAVIDHLITSKGNAVVDLSDEYQAKISAEYDKLQGIQAGVKATGPTEESTTSIEETITNIRKHRTEWKEKANLALENGQGSLFQPAIDYWDETKSPIKSLGSAYQRLAVLSRKADRDIETVVRKTEWDAISTYVGKQKDVEDRDSIKNGSRPQGSDPNVIYDRISNGDDPLFPDAGGIEYLNEDGSNFGYNIVEGKQVPRVDSNGIPLIVRDKDGRTYLNPKSNLDSMNQQEMDVMWSRIQSNPDFPGNFSVTVNGELAQDWEKRIKSTLGNSPVQSPQQLWLTGKVLSQVPIASLPHAIDKLKLSPADHSKALLLREAVNEGLPLDQLRNVQARTQKSMQQTLEYITDLEIPNLNGAKPNESLGVVNDVIVRNNMVLPIIATMFGLKKDSKQYNAFMDAYKSAAIGKTGYELVTDATLGDNRSVATLLQSNPEAKSAVMFVMADLFANPGLYQDKNGQINIEKLDAVVSSYSLNTKNRMGVVTLQANDGDLIAIRQPNYSYISTYVRNPEKRMEDQAALLTNVLNTYHAVTNIRGANKSAIKTQKLSVQLTDTAVSIFPDLDKPLFDQLVSSIKAVQKNQGSTNIGTAPAAVDMMRLAVASSAGVQREYGGKPTDSLEQKLALAKVILADLEPSSTWGMELDLNNSSSQFINSSRGGIPIGFKTIHSKTMFEKDGKDGKDKKPINLLKVALPSGAFINGLYTPTNRITNEPALSLPSYPQGSAQYLELGKDITDSAVVAKVLEANPDEPKPIKSTILTFADTAPHTQPQNNSVYIENASAISTKEMTAIFGESGNVPIGSTTDFMSWFNLNADTFVTVSKSIPALNETKDIIATELATGGTRNLFTNANIPLMIEAAKAKGAKTNTDVAAYMFGVVKTKILNIKPKDNWNKTAAKRAEQELSIRIPEGTFAVPSGKRAGKVLVNPSDPTYFDQIKTAGFLGYSIFQEEGTEDVYISKDVIPKDDFDTPMTLLLGGKQSSEPDDAYTQRFTNAFTYQQNKINLEAKAKEAVADLVDNTYFNISNPRPDATILPSQYEAEYNIKYKEFREVLNLDGVDVDPKDAYLAASIDWKHFWLDNGFLPDTLEYADPSITDINRIPDKYRLPLTPTTYSGSESVKVLRESYGSPIPQQQVNVALEILTKDDGESAVVYKDYDAASVKRIRQFTKDGWNPVAFEFQMRLVGSAINETDPNKIIPQMALESFPLTGQDVIKHLSLTRSGVKELQPNNPTGIFQELPEVIAFNSAFKKELQEVATDLKKDPKYPYIAPSLDWIVTNTMTDKFYGVPFKIAYLEKWVLPTGRSAGKTTIENRKQFIKDYILKLLNQ